MEKITAGNLYFFFFWSKIKIYLFLGFPKGCPSYRRSLQLSKENIQHLHANYLLFYIFMGHFCPPGSGFRSSNSNQWGSLRIRIRIHNPASLTSFCATKNRTAEEWFTRQVVHSSQNFIGQPQSSKYDPVHDVQPQSSGYSLEQAQNLKYGDEQLQRTPLVPVLVALNKLAKTFYGLGFPFFSWMAHCIFYL